MTRTEDTARERELERYLLGTLSDDERDRLEAALLEDHALFLELDAAEGILIDRYLEGDLPAEERQLFEKRLLPTERAGNRLAMTSALERLAARRTQPAADEGSSENFPLARLDLPRPVRGRSATVWLAWAACLVLLLATGYLSVLNGRLQTELDTVQTDRQVAIERAVRAEQEGTEELDALAELRVQTLERDERLSQLRQEVNLRDERIAELEREADVREQTAVRAHPEDVKATVLFLALATRTHQKRAALSLPLTGHVKLQLDLDRLRLKGPLSAVVERDGVPVWHEDGLQPETSGLETMLPLNLPAQIFTAGEYKIIVKDAEGKPEPSAFVGSYQLTVRHR